MNVERAIRVNWRNLALGHTTVEAELATFVVDARHPAIHDANFMYGITARTEIEVEALWSQARARYAHCDTLTFRLGPGASPHLESPLALAGTERSGSLVMLLEGEPRGSAAPHDIRSIGDDAGWSAFVALKRADWAEHAVKLREDPQRTEIPDGLAATSRLKCPPVRYFMAYVGGTPAGCFNAWEGIDGVGQVEDLFVLPAFRNRGVGRALIHHCVADARKHGAGPVVICSDPADSPKNLYAAMGWRPLALCRQYGVRVERDGAVRAIGSAP